MPLKPQASFPSPDLRAILNKFYTEIDGLVALQFGAGLNKATIVYTGNDYVLLKFVINQLIKSYTNAGWFVKDVSGQRKETYILEFRKMKDE